MREPFDPLDLEPLFERALELDREHLRAFLRELESSEPALAQTLRRLLQSDASGVSPVDKSVLEAFDAQDID